MNNPQDNPHATISTTPFSDLPAPSNLQQIAGLLRDAANLVSSAESAPDPQERSRRLLSALWRSTDAAGLLNDIPGLDHKDYRPTGRGYLVSKRF